MNHYLISVDPPKITEDLPVSPKKSYGKKVTFRIKAEGRDLQFQWQKNKKDIKFYGGTKGANTSEFCINAGEDISKHVGLYRCVVSNHGGSVISNEVQLVAGMFVNKNKLKHNFQCTFLL